MTPTIAITKADGVKCPRCYHYSHSLNHDNLCNKCVAILCKHYPTHEATSKIIENLALRGLEPQDNPEWNSPVSN